MATQGTNAALGFWTRLESTIVGKRLTVPACTMVRVSAHLQEDTTANTHGVRALIYTTGGVLVAQSAVRTDISTTAAAYDFTMTTVLSAGTYDFCVIGNNNSNEVQVSNAFDSADYIQEGLSGTVGDFPVGPTAPDPSTLVEGFQNWSILIEYTEGGSTEATITNASPQAVALTTNGRAASMNPFSNVFIREVLINEAGSPVTNRTGISVHVWYSGAPNGAPDLSLSSLTTDANGTASWSIPIGGLVYNQPIFYVATDGGASLSQYTCARMTPNYT